MLCFPSHPIHCNLLQYDWSQKREFVHPANQNLTKIWNVEKSRIDNKVKLPLILKLDDWRYLNIKKYCTLIDPEMSIGLTSSFNGVEDEGRLVSPWLQWWSRENS